MKKNKFNDIFSCFTDYLPKKWNKLIIFYWNYKESSSFNFFIDLGKGYQNFKEIGLQVSDYIDIFSKLKYIMKNDLEQLETNKKWTAFMMCVDSSGKFNVEYGFDVVDEKFILYEKKWMSKFLP